MLALLVHNLHWHGRYDEAVRGLWFLCFMALIKEIRLCTISQIPKYPSLI